MKATTVLTSTVVLSSMFLGTVATAQAATLTKSYFVETAGKQATYDTSASGANPFRASGSADHFAALASIFDRHNKDYVQSNSGAFLDVYDDGTARFYGMMEQRGNANKQFEIDVLFTGRRGYQEGQEVKKGKSSNDDKFTWDFYNIDASSKIIGRGDNAALGEIKIEDASGGRFVVQLGQGANDKNNNFGFSTWFREQGTSGKHSDFNVNLIERPLPPSEAVPEPTMGLALAGLAGAGALRRKKKAASK